MRRVLIVSDVGKECDRLYGLVDAAARYEVKTATCGEGALQTALSEDCDVVVLNTPLASEPGFELAEQIVAETGAFVILLVGREEYDAVSLAYEEKGIAVLEKPLSASALLQALRLMTALHSRLNHLRSENNTLKSKIDEIRLVDRAKCVLIQYLGMTEPMAHRHIEKQAMDMRVSKRRIAEDILRTYEM